MSGQNGLKRSAKPAGDLEYRPGHNCVFQGWGQEIRKDLLLPGAFTGLLALKISHANEMKLEGGIVVISLVLNVNHFLKVLG